jgi:hypothetical protein
VGWNMPMTYSTGDGAIRSRLTPIVRIESGAAGESGTSYHHCSPALPTQSALLRILAAPRYYDLAPTPANQNDPIFLDTTSRETDHPTMQPIGGRHDRTPLS